MYDAGNTKPALCDGDLEGGGVGGEVEGELKREGACVCLKLLLAAVWQKPSQHCKIVILI